MGSSSIFLLARTSAFTSGATASMRLVCFAPICSPRAVCRRAIFACVPWRLDWRNAALPGLFVGGSNSAGIADARGQLHARNSRILEQRHPGYPALVNDQATRDALADARRRIDLQQWRQRGRKWRRSAILITHDAGGGVEQRLKHSVERHQAAGRRTIILRPAETTRGEPAVAVHDATAEELPNLVFAMPRELASVLRLLRVTGPEMIEAHHLADHAPAIYELVARLGVTYDVHIHDYAWFCPRISLVGGSDRYCGEPDLRECEACIVDSGHFLQEDITVAALRARSATFLATARRVVVPCNDAGSRIRRHFGRVEPVTIGHEDDAAIAPPVHRAAPNTRVMARTRPSVCVVGAIGIHKGYDILLACARDAAWRDLDLNFVVVGHTIDDARMLATGRVFITGPFESDEAVELIAEQNAALGFVTSICPETWCLSLGDIWRAGLQAVAFDIGAPAERIRATGRGFLLPLGLSAGAINNTLLKAMWT